MDTILEKLQTKNIQPSFQRIKILELLDKKRQHLNVNEIYEELVREIPTISKTTIYNNLKTFIDKGLIQCLTITPEETRYDFNTTPHHHLLCKRCGRIFDVNVHCSYSEIMEIDGHIIEEIHGYFKGICRECISLRDTDNNKKEVYYG